MEDGLNIRTKGTNVLQSGTSEFAGLDSLAALGLRAYNPAELEENVVHQLEQQLETKREPMPLSAFLEEKNLVERVRTQHDESSEPKLSQASLKKMIFFLEASKRELMRKRSGIAVGGVSRVEELQIKIELLKTLHMLSEKAEQERYEKLVRTGKIIPEAHKHSVGVDPESTREAELLSFSSPEKETKVKHQDTDLKKKNEKQKKEDDPKEKNTQQLKQNPFSKLGASTNIDPFGKVPLVRQREDGSRSKGKEKKRDKDRKKKRKKEKEGKDVGTDNEKMKKESEEDSGKIDCPICFRKFAPDVIETHASTCSGTRTRGKQAINLSEEGQSSSEYESESDSTSEEEVELGDVNESSKKGKKTKRRLSTNSKKSSGDQMDSSVDDYEPETMKARVKHAKNLDSEFALWYKAARNDGKEEDEAMAWAAGQIAAGESIERVFELGVDEDSLYATTGELRISRRFYNMLFPYQKTALEWFWGLHCQGTGGILGDEMGLGKTVQISSFLGALKESGFLKPSIICCPATTIAQWVSELHKWAPRLRVLVLHSSGAAIEVGRWTRQRVVSSVSKQGDVLVTTYQGLRLASDLILGKRWGYVVLDEGHKIRNPDADITLVCKQLKTVHRIVMTGSPIQNNLRELWSLFDFVSPGRLGTLPMFENQFAIPINAGGYSSASAVQVRMAYHCALVLKETIEPFLLRRMKKDVAQQLPEKTEQVLFCNLTQAQRDAYVEFLDHPDVQQLLNNDNRGKKSKMTFKLIRALQHICNHPDIYLDKLRRGAGVMDFISNANAGEEEEGYSDKTSLQSDGFRMTEPHFDPTKPKELSTKEVQAKENIVLRSGKMLVLQIIMRTWKQEGHRVLLFSQGRLMLDILEQFVQQEGYDYLRMDGTTAIKARANLIDRFNDESSGVFVFLLTTKVGGLGINLIGADRVVLYDPDWNPSTDAQARERAWRVGQTKKVTIYRLITSGTIEEKMYHRQIFKQYLTNKILSDPRQRRFLKYSGLRDLFTLGDIGEDTAGAKRGSSSSKRPRSIASGSAQYQMKRRREASEERSRALLSREYNYEKDIKAAEVAAASADTETSDLFQEGRIDLEDSKGDESTSILQSLFDGSKGGFRQAFRHDTVEEFSKSSPDERIIEHEANRIAQRAAAALRREQQAIQETSAGVHVPTWTGISGSTGRIGGSASSQILQQLRTRNATNPNSSVAEESFVRAMAADSSDANMRIARRLQQFLREPRTTRQVIDEFRDSQSVMGVETFREILRQMGRCVNKTWTLRPEFS